MQEIKIPEGCKASIDFEKRVVVIEEEKSKFKRGDIVRWEGLRPFVGIILRENRHDGRENYVIDDPTDSSKKLADSCYVNHVRLATPSEAQLLFDALAKEGKKWNATTLQIEDIEKDILVPESVGIYKHKYRLDLGLFVSFNNNSQFLGYNSSNKQWIVTSELSKYKKVQCKLTPCKREDLKSGDTAFTSETFRLDDNMLSDKGRYVKIIGKSAVKINKIGEPIYDRTFHNHWYKVEPINK